MVRFNVSPEDYERYRADYIKLYIENIRAIVMSEDTSRPFLSSSPSNGVETITEDWVANDPQSPQYGDSKCAVTFVVAIDVKKRCGK